MASINASTSGAGGVITTSDNTGTLNLQSGGTTKVSISSSGTIVDGGLIPRGGGNSYNNVGIGFSALGANTTGEYNTAVGSTALQANLTGSNLIAIGAQALYYNTANDNLAIGTTALSINTTGTGNTAVGTGIAGVNYGALRNNNGSYNVAIGNSSLVENSTGSNNTAMGYQSGATGGSGSLTTGSNNIAIGYRAGLSSASAANQIMIGTDVTSAGGDNSVNFGKYGNVVYNVFTSNATWTRSSDLRLKKNIVDSELGLDFINKLRTVKYNWKPSYEVPQELKSYNEENYMDLNVTMHGFIAQEVKQALDEVGVSDFSGWSQQEDGTQAISYEMFIMPLVKAVKEQQTIINDLKARIETLEAK